MARFPSTEQQSSDTIDTINLTRALSRLEAKILTSDPHSRLRHSPYERTKTAANLKYARTLLLRLEHSTSALKTQSRKHSAQETLLQQRNLIKLLNDRLYELGQQDDGTLPSDSSEDDDILALISNDDSDPSSPSAAVAAVPASPAESAQPQAQTLQIASESSRAISNPTTSSPSETTSTLRPRRPAQQPSNSISTTTAHSLGPTPLAPSTSLFNPSRNQQPSPSKPTSPTPNTTFLLESQDSTQVDLTNSLLSLASQLKSSAQSFSSDLALDTSQLSQTETSLGKNQDGLDTASKRMGTLQKMSEGRWWWGRMVLYAGIGGLWIVAVLLVFGGPKLRF
ncbi:hypothetical protein MMC10_009003 [Thelotrema lepadinum]|nr:hypothetical protein [Thelotrema lepadinum]